MLLFLLQIDTSATAGRGSKRKSASKSAFSRKSRAEMDEEAIKEVYRDEDFIYPSLDQSATTTTTCPGKRSV